MANRGVISQLWGYVKAERKWWLLPAMAMLLLLGSLLLFAQESPLVAFIYAIF